MKKWQSLVKEVIYKDKIEEVMYKSNIFKAFWNSTINEDIIALDFISNPAMFQIRKLRRKKEFGFYFMPPAIWLV